MLIHISEGSQPIHFLYAASSLLLILSDDVFSLALAGDVAQDKVLPYILLHS